MPNEPTTATTEAVEPTSPEAWDESGTDYADRGEAAANALEVLRKRQADQARDLKGGPSAPTQPSAPVPATIPGVFDSECKARGDLSAAQLLFASITRRKLELQAAGLHGLAARWDTVLHSLASASAFTPAEWSPR